MVQTTYRNDAHDDTFYTLELQTSNVLYHTTNGAILELPLDILRNDTETPVHLPYTRHAVPAFYPV